MYIFQCTEYWHWHLLNLFVALHARCVTSQLWLLLRLPQAATAVVKVRLVSIVIPGRREGSVSQDRAAVGQGSGYKSRAGAAHQRGAGQCSRGPQIEVYRSGVSEKGEV